MKPEQRQTYILQQLRQHPYVSVEALSQMLQVSQMTIRRDLAELNAMGIITRRHGGASLAPGQGDFEWPLRLRQAERADVKRKIGQAAASYVREGDVVVIDGGTTTLEAARSLTQNRLTVVSHFQPILCELIGKPNIRLISTGGVLRADNQTYVGPFAIQTLRQINANVAIMATSYLSLSRGLTNRNMDEAEIKRTMIEISEKVILVMDSAKMHRHTLSTVGAIEAVQVLVTDANLSQADRQAIEERGVEVKLVEV